MGSDAESKRAYEERRVRTGKVVRLSRLILAYVESRKRGRESLDGTLRRVFGLPDRKGSEQPLRTYFILDNGGRPLVRYSEEEARGEAVIQAVKRGDRTYEKPIKVREEVPWEV